MPEDTSFPDRLADAIGGRYSAAMRRSVQTVVLYEANRCLKDRYSALRPFQRKIALYDTAVDLINSFEVIPPYLRTEIMYRTASSKLPLSADLAWRRMKLIDREIQKIIIPKIKPFLESDKDHKDICSEFIQDQYEIVSGVKGKKHPAFWEYSHLNIFLAYKLFYDKGEMNPHLPSARDPDPNRVVPNKKPIGGEYPPGASSKDEDDNSIGRKAKSNGKENLDAKISKHKPDTATRPKTEADERRALLQEVREHLELLKEFEGIIPATEMSKRKKELFMSLPSAPSSAKKAKHVLTKKPKKSSQSSNISNLPTTKVKKDDSDDDDNLPLNALV
mmetsp:Transcript_14629/g.14108  ORF Transcript_14629/g.14108 Transcript_14629/m.14108 type:complete len:333 (-) Transcript_14629:83-1081(-)|eukprot:CAMPEP_0197830316 /NCGR_PEP_ID=MMETSP1437-20131217/6913_1 /TAXON_ID=49252 ORGANISM="Eucampia antarctica, Strain CCMP1452" /NCGR_SAMPLE_ID=MMETSP1437 /ASSEMBLY_ACC=CAM_ASM_001096 /LENGTH=332 /DNA_ID=CAMNT_0043432621 /DNA_START=138 /DNA_END=1136 /DNA_ORIENTATION=+